MPSLLAHSLYVSGDSDQNLDLVQLDTTGMFLGLCDKYEKLMCFLILCRRFREINENNMKKFIDERKRLTMKHYRQVELLKKTHTEQVEKFSKDSDKVRQNDLSHRM